jgi:hypothetical protein
MKAVALLAATLATIALSGCGGSGGGGTLSKSDYRTKLRALGHEAQQAQANVQKGLSANTVAELHARLLAFAATAQHLGDEVAALKPPKDAEAANAELANGEHDSARAVRAAAAAIQNSKTPAAALAYLQKSLSNAKGAHELDEALTKLKNLGYTTGS